MKPRLGLCAFSCHQHWQAVQHQQPGIRFTDAPSFLEYAQSLGAEGVQTNLRNLDEARAVRSRIDATGGYYEGDVRLPRDEAGLESFAANLKLVKEAGGTVIRSVLLWTRRYESFHSMDDVRAFRERSQNILRLCEPVLKQHGVRLALENHKDQLVFEQIEMLRRFSSEWIGVCVDSGNNIALLEEPHAVVESLAPFAASVHLKDMAVQPAPEGFLLSEVPLGTGFLDLPKMIRLLRQANPGIVFNLEMATRDPLHIPCLKPEYWNVFENRHASVLQEALALVHDHPVKQPVPMISDKTPDVILSEEAENNRTCLAWMKANIV